MIKRRYRNQVDLLIEAAGQVVLGPNPLRVGLVIGSDETNSYRISFGRTASVSVGLLVPAGGRPIILAPCLLGDSIAEQITAAPMGDDCTVTLIEILEDPYPLP